jgi:hypothetical protein
MTAMNCLTGYDGKTDAQKFSLPIPPERFAWVKNFVELNEDDPDAFDSYELGDRQARDIARPVSHQDLPPNLRVQVCARALILGGSQRPL